MKQTLSIRLPKDVRAELDRISRLEHVSLSDLVRESLREYVALYQFRKLRKQVMPFAETQGLLTDEDIFRKIS